MKPYCIILNPQSLKSHRRKFELLLATMERGGLGFDVVTTRSGPDITDQTRLALEKGYRYILPVGGDGTLSQSAKGFMSGDSNAHPEAALVPLPFGTGHDFYNGFIPIDGQGRFDWLLDPFETTRISVGTFKYEGEQQYFINSLSCGISSQIIENHTSFRINHSKASYFISTLRAIRDYRGFGLSVTVQGVTKQQPTLLFMICKGPYVGGGMKFLPHALHVSNQAEAIWIPTMGLFKVIRSLPRIYQGRTAGVAGVTQVAFDELQLQGPAGPMAMEADGELYKVRGTVTVNILPDCLAVARPRPLSLPVDRSKKPE